MFSYRVYAKLSILIDSDLSHDTRGIILKIRQLVIDPCSLNRRYIINWLFMDFCEFVISLKISFYHNFHSVQRAVYIFIVPMNLLVLMIISITD